MLDSIHVFTKTRSGSFCNKHYLRVIRIVRQYRWCVMLRDASVEERDCRSFLDILSRIIYRIERDISRLLSFFFVVNRVV
jgi:hypothetical protein